MHVELALPSSVLLVAYVVGQHLLEIARPSLFVPFGNVKISTAYTTPVILLNPPVVIALNFMLVCRKNTDLHQDCIIKNALIFPVFKESRL